MDNKLWESHRLILPEFREKFLSSNIEKASPPAAVESLELLENRIKYAIHLKKPILVTYYKNDAIKECIAFSFRLMQNCLECSMEYGQKLQINGSDIIDVGIL